MGFGSILKALGGVGAAVAAPFTAGTSLAFLPAVLGGASAIGGALESTTGARTTTGGSTPTVAPAYQGLADLLRQRAMDRLNSSVDMSGYAANGVSGINDAFKGITQASDNNLTSRGLASSPVAGVVGQNLNIARGGDITQFLNTLPLLQRQFQNEDMTNAGNVLRTGIGTSTTGTAPGSVAGGAFGSAAEMLAYLAGKGVLGGSSGTSTVKNLPGSVGTGDFGLPIGVTANA